VTWIKWKYRYEHKKFKKSDSTKTSCHNIKNGIKRVQYTNSAFNTESTLPQRNNIHKLEHIQWAGLVVNIISNVNFRLQTRTKTLEQTLCTTAYTSLQECHKRLIALNAGGHSQLSNCNCEQHCLASCCKTTYQEWHSQRFTSASITYSYLKMETTLLIIVKTSKQYHSDRFWQNYQYKNVETPNRRDPYWYFYKHKHCIFL